MNSIASAPSSQGIERAPIDAQPTLKSGGPNDKLQDTLKFHEPKADVSQSATQRSSLDIIRRLPKSLRAKFHRRPQHDFNVTTDQRFLDKAALAPRLAPNPQVATEEDRFDVQPPAKPSLPPAKDFLHSPVQTLKSVAHIEGGGGMVETLATKDVSHGAGVQLVRANEELADARTDDEEALALEKLASLKSARQDSYVRWTLDRHIARVRRRQPRPVAQETMQYSLQQSQTSNHKPEWNEYGRDQAQYYLEKYGGHYVGASGELPEPTEAALISSFERILLTSTPVQDAFMTMRRISHWEYPWESGTYLVIYFFFLLYSYITRAFLLYALFIVIRRKYFPPTIPELCEDLKLAEDEGVTAHDLSQLIDQHGAHGWVDPLIEQAGPTALLHMEDLVNFMEMLRNFYEWRDPTRTAVTLCWLISAWIVITITPVSILVKMSFFAAGVMFFGLTPISARFPQYRLLFNPLIWLFWRIPTHSEWAIIRLQAEAAQQLEIMSKRLDLTPQSSPGSLRAPQENLDRRALDKSTPVRIGRYHCKSEKCQGNLVISTERVSFEIHLTASERWSVSYRDLESMRKAPGPSTVTGADLIFIDMAGKEYRAAELKHRDEVFSQIIGYSNVEWQRTG